VSSWHRRKIFELAVPEINEQNSIAEVDNRCCLRCLLGCYYPKEAMLPASLPNAPGNTDTGTAGARTQMLEVPKPKGNQQNLD